MDRYSELRARAAEFAREWARQGEVVVLGPVREAAGEIALIGLDESYPGVGLRISWIQPQGEVEFTARIREFLLIQQPDAGQPVPRVRAVPGDEKGAAPAGIGARREPPAG